MAYQRHPGKFESSGAIGELFNAILQEGFSDDSASGDGYSDQSSAELFKGPFDLKTLAETWPAEVEQLSAEERRDLKYAAGAILTVDNQGFVEVKLYPGKPELHDDWIRLQEAYYGGDNDEDEDLEMAPGSGNYEANAAKLNAAEKFFYEHAGYSYSQGSTKAQQQKARRDNAKALANAEVQAEQRGWEYIWDEDPHGADTLGDVPAEDVSEILQVLLKDENGEVLASLGGILMGYDSQHNRNMRRLVEAELAVEGLHGHQPNVSKRRAPVGYIDCACRDCFDVAIGRPGVLCNDCESAGCTAFNGECQRADAYGAEYAGNARSKRQQLEALVWKHTHRDYKGKRSDGTKCINVNTGAGPFRGQGSYGTESWPLSSLTDEQLCYQLPQSVRGAHPELCNTALRPNARRGASPRSEPDPKVYLSMSEGRYRVIQQGVPIGRDETSASAALKVAAHYKLKVADRMWNGDTGTWEPLTTVPNARQAPIDEHAAHELELYLDNDARFSMDAPSGIGRDVLRNMMKKYRSGRYDHALAPKGWGHVVESAAKQYAKEHSSSVSDWSRIFSPATRDKVAQDMADEFLRRAKAGEFEHVR